MGAPWLHNLMYERGSCAPEPLAPCPALAASPGRGVTASEKKWVLGTGNVDDTAAVAGQVAGHRMRKGMVVAAKAMFRVMVHIERVPSWYYGYYGYWY